MKKKIGGKFEMGKTNAKEAIGNTKTNAMNKKNPAKKMPTKMTAATKKMMSTKPIKGANLLQGKM